MTISHGTRDISDYIILVSIIKLLFDVILCSFSLTDRGWFSHTKTTRVTAQSNFFWKILTLLDIARVNRQGV